MVIDEFYVLISLLELVEPSVKEEEATLG